MDWIKVRDDFAADLPRPNETVLVFSLTDGIGLAQCMHRAGSPRWYWIHKRINDSAEISDVTHFMRIVAPEK